MEAWRKNKHSHKRKKVEGRGGIGKSIVVGVKDRSRNKINAEMIENIRSTTISKFVHENTEDGTEAYTDGGGQYAHMKRKRERVAQHR